MAACYLTAMSRGDALEFRAGGYSTAWPCSVGAALCHGQYRDGLSSGASSPFARPLSETFLTGHLPCVVQEDYGEGDGASSPAGIPPEEADWWGSAGSGDDFADGDGHQEDGDAGQEEPRGGRRASARMLAAAKVARSGRLPCLASSCSRLFCVPSMCHDESRRLCH